jgi:GTPase SAR1 family protein
MLRQVFIFHNQKPIFSYTLALALNGEELKHVINIIEPNMILPTPGETLHRPISKFQIFHRSYGNTYFLIIVDLVDSFEYINDILIKIINKFKEFFANPEDIMEQSVEKNEFIKFLHFTQKELHSKISIVGPTDSGKTTLYNLLKSGQERKIMDFANASTYEIDNLSFDIWDFILKDNFSLLWPKFIGGSDLIVLIFDSKDYGPKLIQYYMSLIENHARYSKMLILANKSEHISEEELEYIKSSINIQDVKKLSLIDPVKAKERIDLYFRDSLNLKRDLPSNFENLKSEAEKLNLENRISEAVSKYEELINICNEYQNFTYFELFQTKLDQLKVKLEEQQKAQKLIETSKSFAPPKQIKFTKKISVKTLPKASPVLKSSSTNVITKSSPKSIESNLTSTKIQETPQPSKLKKLSLKPEDIKISLKAKIEKIQQIKNSEPKEVVQKIPELNKVRKIQPNAMIQKIKPKEVIEPTIIPDEVISKEKFGLHTELQKLIRNNGSDLSTELCEFFINEMTEALDSPLNREDLKLAAEVFCRIEKSIL